MGSGTGSSDVALLEQRELLRGRVWMSSRARIVGGRGRGWLRRADGGMRRDLRTPRAERDDGRQRVRMGDRFGRRHQAGTGVETGSAAPSTTWLPQAAPAV